MIPLFLAILAALGAALVFRGRKLRGLFVISAVTAAEAAYFGLSGRWGWLAFALGGIALCAIGVAAARNDW
jgi:hypothetical protein